VLFQSTSNIILYQKIKDKLENKTNKTVQAIISSTLATICSYPFDLAVTRMSSDMTRYGHKRINSSAYELFTRIFDEESRIIYLINK
jgi:hypothetical protein